MQPHRHTCDVCGVNLQCNDSQCKNPTGPSTWNCGVHDITPMGAMACLKSRRAGRPIFTPRVEQAMQGGICICWNLDHKEHLELERAVRNGVLAKGKGGPFPKIKTVYGPVGFDFQLDREAGEADLRRAHMIDLARGVAHHFPWVSFES